MAFAPSTPWKLPCIITWDGSRNQNLPTDSAEEAIFIEWEGTQIVRKEPCLYQGVQGGRGAADTRWRERERLAPGGPDQTQRAVPLARCVPQGWGSGIAAAGGPAAGSPESAAAGCQSGGGRCAAGGGVGAQNWSTSSGYRFFAKSLQ